MSVIRVRKAKSGDGYKIKFRNMGVKLDITKREVVELIKKQKVVLEPSKNLPEDIFLKVKNSLFPATNAKGTAPVKKEVTTVKKEVTPVKKEGFSVHSRVGLQKVLEGEGLILDVLRKADQPLTASEIGKRIFKNELGTRGVEFVVEVRGFKFYAYLNKHYIPMVNKGFIKAVGLTKGHRRMEKLWGVVGGY